MLNHYLTEPEATELADKRVELAQLDAKYKLEALERHLEDLHVSLTAAISLAGKRNVEIIWAMSENGDIEQVPGSATDLFFMPPHEREVVFRYLRTKIHGQIIVAWYLRQPPIEASPKEIERFKKEKKIAVVV